MGLFLPVSFAGDKPIVERRFGRNSARIQIGKLRREHEVTKVSRGDEPLVRKISVIQAKESKPDDVKWRT